MTGRRLAAALLWLLALGAPASAQFRPAPRPEAVGFSSSRLARIDSLIEPLVARGELPGAVVFLARDGQIVMHKAYGYRDTRTKVPMRKDDIFRIASQSKAITSLAVMMLWEEGRFGLDDPIERYIPEFANPRVMTRFNPADSSYESAPARRRPTIRQLLTHTAGLDYPAIGSDEFKAIYAKAGIPSGIGTNSATICDKMRVLGKLPLKHEPGERFTYSLGLDVLGCLVELVSGMPFDRFLRTRIFDPLGMRDTWFSLPADRAERLVALHDLESGQAVPRHDPVFDGVDPDYPKRPGGYFSGGAGLSGSIEDYARFLQLFLNGGELNGVRLLSPRTVELMLTDQLPGLPNEFGLGFALETPANDYQSPQSVGSFSWGGAFRTTYWADSRQRLVALLYTNTYGGRPPPLGNQFAVLTYAAMIR
jgi:CubicO group peptidase (beta-lactamase class C family)